MSDCIPWPKARNNYGYGLISRHGKTQLAHRWYYQLANGPISNTRVVRHRCDNPPCVNVLHLELGTHKQNMRDRSERGRTFNQYTKENR
ncbi:HNH endonuclease signature motif containing protein [Streptomyces sp. G1]|uniref:HNH endonuclease signature motif containing protein n=1 Tax=Streptomyces sp. G1 TaxID=361572 RepID=UPI002030E44A|nr:HNH endonuclease signature motif containing protein [Streptomyces sp. G1]MCM1967239.1 HNH endonuclease [Streptomyces sp. G1]